MTNLETTVRELAPRLLRYCLGVTADRALAEEAAQEALAALVARWRRWGAPDSPQAFAFAVARRRAGRALWRRRLLAPLDGLRDGHHPDPDPDPEERTAGRAELARVLAALRRLAPGDRQALLLAAAGELTAARAARVLAISVPAFKMRLHRARRRLRRLLEREESPS